MFFKNHQLMFLMFLVVGTIIAFSANSWFIAWLGLEINLMSMIPLILININTPSTEACIKYFLPQAMGSVFIILASIMEFVMMNSYTSYFSSCILIMALSLKAGVAPLHYWFPQVMHNLTWMMASLIITWQKIAPFVLLSYNLNNFLITTLIFSSALIGAMGGFNQNSSKMIITYSSISHSAWMMALAFTGVQQWMFYFLIYCSITLSMIILINMFGLNKISFFSSVKMNIGQKASVTLNLLSLGGLPPLLGFIAKLNAISFIISFTNNFLIMSLILSSLISLYFYLKLTYNFMMNNSQEMLMYIGPCNSFKFSNYLMIFSIMGNLGVPILVSLT